LRLIGSNIPANRGDYALALRLGSLAVGGSGVSFSSSLCFI
jgi:hypothetical protein